MTRLAAGILSVALVCAAPPQGREQLNAYLDAIARRHLEKRSGAVAQIKTRADAERRKAAVRAKILGLIGGLFEHRGPVAVKQFGSITGDGFRIEKLAYESLPGFWVTANLFLPAVGAGPFPAVLLSAGHGPNGKIGNYSFGVNLARNGIAALAYDPPGQGERLQYFDPQRKASAVSGPTGEHGEANIPTMLIGEHISRYFINDAMRGIDYLTARKDIDPARIGAFGCSGGGTATAYLAAFDDRVKAAAPGCYITSFQELLPSATGNQEAEQSIPHFIEQGLDIADWVELAAPKPYAIVATTEDMFPFAGARRTYDEAHRIFGLYGAAENLQLISGPGGHGALGPISPDILGFFARHLKGATEKPAFAPVRPERPDDLLCTPTGQVAASIGGETVPSINRRRASSLPVPKPAKARLAETVRKVAAVSAKPGAPPPAVEVTATAARDGYRLESVTISTEPGITIPAQVAIPAREGRKPAVLLLAPDPAAGLDRLAKSGRIVVAFEPRPSPAGAEGLKSSLLGPYNLLSLRAFLSGKTIVGMRTDDTIRILDWLAARNDVDASAITAYGRGALGVVVLHAAVLDARIARVVVEDALVSYRMIVDQPLHRNVSEVVIPGVLRSYDIPDLILAAAPRPVTVVNPKDAAGSDARMFPTGTHVRGVSRTASEPLPLE